MSGSPPLATPTLPDLPGELGYFALILCLFVLPQMLQRLRIPTAITCFGMGVAAHLGLGLFAHDRTVYLLSTLGIVSLFLFAGLEVDFAVLRRHQRVLIQHLVVRFLLLVGATVAIKHLLRLHTVPSALVALGMLTPSAGFILSSLGNFGMDETATEWVKAKVIATEILALVTLFFLLQSQSLWQLVGALVVMGALLAVLPTLFQLFAQKIAPVAPKSEFAFLLMTALLFALITRHLGAYYLVGAFLVGLGAQRFHRLLPTSGSDHMLHALELFAAFFIPFYFFNAGVKLRPDDFSIQALMAGVVFLLVFVPLGGGSLLVHRNLALAEPLKTGTRIAIALSPTLVFTLVMVDLLRTGYRIPHWLPGGLVIYAVVSTLLPGLLLRLPPPDYDEPHLGKTLPPSIPTPPPASATAPPP